MFKANFEKQSFPTHLAFKITNYEDVQRMYHAVTKKIFTNCCPLVIEITKKTSLQIMDPIVRN